MDREISSQLAWAQSYVPSDPGNANGDSFRPLIYIDIVNQQTRHTCPRLHFLNRETHQAVETNAGSWWCEACADEKINSWLPIIQELEWQSFLTLTSRVSLARKQYSALRRLTAKFQRFLRACRYKFHGLEYFWVLSAGKTGIAHYHMLLNVMPSQRWLAEKWFGVTGAHQVHVAEAKPEHLIYTLGNAAKLNHHIPERLRRFFPAIRRLGHSRGIDPVAYRPSTVTSWEFRGSERRDFQNYLPTNGRIHEASEGSS